MNLVIILSLLVHYAAANTEKLIFKADLPTHIPCLDVTYGNLSILSTPFSELHNTIQVNKNEEYSEQQHYLLKGLQLGSSYELRISYPAVTPTDFTMIPVRVCSTEANTVSYTIKVTGRHTGVSAINREEYAVVLYNIVLDTLYAQFIFSQLYKLVLVILGVSFMGYCYIIPSIRHYISYIIDLSDKKGE
ncbi:hypothetical protein BDB01DRAFT_713387 [Pilobolus umbonatus]|nr:hypothetical protein BDB01DRAFT_713387 [Pilobolus umbonatus]